MRGNVICSQPSLFENAQPLVLRVTVTLLRGLHLGVVLRHVEAVVATITATEMMRPFWRPSRR